jgi:serine/threonine protein kinase
MLDQQDEDIVRCKMKLRRAEDSVIEKERAMESLLEENAALLERVSLLEEMLSGPSPDRQHSYSPASGFVGDHWDGKLISGKKISIGDHDVIPRYFLDASVPSKVISAVDVSDVFGEPREVVLKVFDHVEEVQFMNDCGVMTKFGKTGMVPQLVATYKTDSNFVAILVSRIDDSDSSCAKLLVNGQNNYQANLLNVPVTLCGNVRFAQQVMQKLLEKVDCLHSNGYTNFRISPKGIVFSDDGEVSLGDSTQCCPIVHAKKGGIECRGGFSAPELLAGKGLSRPRAADVWSVGAVLAWLLGKVRSPHLPLDIFVYSY